VVRPWGGRVVNCAEFHCSRIYVVNRLDLMLRWTALQAGVCYCAKKNRGHSSSHVVDTSALSTTGPSWEISPASQPSALPPPQRQEVLLVDNLICWELQFHGPVHRLAFADCDFAEKFFWIFLIDFVIPLHGYESMEVFYGLVTYRVRTWCVRAVRSCLTSSKKKYV